MKNLFTRIRETKGLPLLLVAIFLFAVFGVLLYSLLNKRAPSSSTAEPSAQSPKTVYDPGGLEKEVNRLSQNKTLSEKDKATKKYLLELVSNESGIINQTPMYKIEYVKSSDDIEIEILTTDVEKAKEESLLWLSNVPGSNGVGLSKSGICSFPVIFYLNFDVKLSLPQNTQFDPNPPGC